MKSLLNRARRRHGARTDGQAAAAAAADAEASEGDGGTRTRDTSPAA